MSEGKIFVRNGDRRKAHVTILKTELVFISAALVLASFVLGFFTGRGGGGAVFEIEPLSYTERALGKSDDALPVPVEEDGEKAVGTESGGDRVPAASPGTSGRGDTPAAPDTGAKININTADSAQLKSLPGIGDVLAGRIIEYREKTGGFKNIYELMDVNGIGEKTFRKLEHLICVE